MNAAPKARPQRSRSRLFWEIASTIEDVRASQALRYRVFAEEMGARLAGDTAGRDQDHYDEHCHHLLVRERDSRRVVGSTRLLSDAGAHRAGGFYSQGEFDLHPLLALPGRRLEVGRTCIDPNHRQGAAIAVLWAGLGEFVKTHRIDWLFGCASIEMADGGVVARAIMNRVRQHAMTEPACRVTPKKPLPSQPPGTWDNVSAPLPPLLKAYFRLGAKACGEACHDPHFDCADILVLVNVHEIDAAYSRHFLGRDRGAD